MNGNRLILVLAVLAIAAGAVAQDQTTQRWDSETLDLFATLPMQDGGRIKPMDTYANYELLKFRARASCKNLEDEMISGLEWLLDTLFFPEKAKQYEVFLVENSEALDAVGMAYEKKRDRYSYNQLAPVIPALFELGRQYAHIDSKQRNLVQTQIVNLTNNIREFELLTVLFDFADKTFPIGESAILAGLFPGKTDVSLSEFLGQTHSLRTKIVEIRENTGLDEEQRNQQLAALDKVLTELEQVSRNSNILALIPPPGTREQNEEWLSPGSAMVLAFQSHEPPTSQLESLELLGGLARTRGDAAAFQSALMRFHGKTVQLAQSRGEYDHIELEVSYYKAKFFSYSLMGFILCFLLATLTWFKPNSTRLWWFAMAALCAPTAYTTAGIVLRCIIRGRPPVTTLYETILFITACAVVLSLLAEYLYRQRAALSLAAFAGALGLFVANRYEAMDGADTMPSMIAVLDTNFWLSTHVTTISMGYAAGLLAGGLGHIYILGKLLGLKRNNPEFYENLARMTYGILCFSFLFSVVGTVLGGIWANYSWGRFWGWDPKENGALMIVLWQAALLHARRGRYVHDFGFCMASIFGGVVVAFSWFGVNLLGVGLHAYGFTSGIAKALTIFYAIEGFALFLGLLAWWQKREATKLKAEG